MTAPRQPVPVQANLPGCGGQVERSGRSQDWLHTQEALIEFLTLGKTDN
jgi:hypothetical protein